MVVGEEFVYLGIKMVVISDRELAGYVDNEEIYKSKICVHYVNKTGDLKKLSFDAKEIEIMTKIINA